MQYLIYVGYAFYMGAALLMIGAILLQEGKGGGLSALGGTQAESAFGSSNPIRRMTVVLAIIFFLLAGFLSFVSPKSKVTFPATESSAPGGAAEKKQPDAETKTGDAAGAEAASPEAKGVGAETKAASPDAAKKGAPTEAKGAASEKSPAPS
ncbi:MAG: preprotein translocase subunit SecG, partial [Planctomycetota bacterium]